MPTAPTDVRFRADGVMSAYDPKRTKRHMTFSRCGVFGTTEKALAFSPPTWAFSAVLVVEGRSNAWHISDRPLRPRGRRRGTLLRSIAGSGRGARREAPRLARKARRLPRRDTGT